MPKSAKKFNLTWEMKMKINGMLQRRLNASGFFQVPGEHFDGS